MPFVWAHSCTQGKQQQCLQDLMWASWQRVSRQTVQIGSSEASTSAATGPQLVLAAGEEVPCAAGAMELARCRLLDLGTRWEARGALCCWGAPWAVWQGGLRQGPWPPHGHGGQVPFQRCLGGDRCMAMESCTAAGVLRCSLSRRFLAVGSWSLLCTSWLSSSLQMTAATEGLGWLASTGLASRLLWVLVRLV